MMQQRASLNLLVYYNIAFLKNQVVNYNLSAIFEMKNDYVTEVKIEGDFFGVSPIEQLELKLRNHTVDDLRDIIKSFDPSLYIHGMNSTDLYDLIFT